MHLVLKSRLSCLHVVLTGFLIIFSSVINADERLDVLKVISQSGAPELTIRLLDQAQPQIDADLYGWIAWEQERLKILSHWQQWNEMLARIEAYPEDIPKQFSEQVTTYKANAYLELGQNSTARKILRDQLWRAEAGESSHYERWRHLIIVSYLREGRIEDARIALLRFNQDFESTDVDWLILQSTILAKAGRYSQAIQVLQGIDTWQAEAMSVLARFRNDVIGHKELKGLVDRTVKEKGIDPEKLATYRVLGYFAATRMSIVDRVVALEQLFQTSYAKPPELFRLSSDKLWDEYREYGRLVGNRAELLMGDDARWLELAAKASAATPVKARALLALLMLESANLESVESAAQLYLKTLGDLDLQAQNLLDHLYNRSETFRNADSIPATIRYQLVDVALKQADISEATRLMSGLTSIPSGTSRFIWLLRQARVLILGGRYDEGIQIMQTLITEYNEATDESTDRILQVIFDLQTIGLDEQAIPLFNQVMSKPIGGRHRREILFWVGDSYKGLEQYEQAALLYLQSAMLPGPQTMDPWAQTARYNAAESLTKAGLIDDARRIYDALLEVTAEPARRSLLNRNIQQLWLYKSE